jgi:hypothetical protein
MKHSKYQQNNYTQDKAKAADWDGLFIVVLVLAFLAFLMLSGCNAQPPIA